MDGNFIIEKGKYRAHSVGVVRRVLESLPLIVHNHASALTEPSKDICFNIEQISECQPNWQDYHVRLISGEKLDLAYQLNKKAPRAERASFRITESNSGNMVCEVKRGKMNYEFHFSHKAD